MKKRYYLIFLLIFPLFSSCQRFYPPEIKLQMINQGDTLHAFYAIIIDGGGSERFNEKGCIYGFKTENTIIDGVSNIFKVESSEKEWFFDWSMSATEHFYVLDTIYYVRAWVKTNAGIGYSNPVRIETKR